MQALLPHTIAAQAAPRVACVDPRDAVLLARIRGQTQDLPLHLQVVRAAPVDPPTPTTLQLVARAEHADLVVQVTTRADGAHVVYVYDTQQRELHMRKTPAPAHNDRFSRSAAAETVAVIVRGELASALTARNAARGMHEEPQGTGENTPPPSQVTQPTQTQPPHEPPREPPTPPEPNPPPATTIQEPEREPEAPEAPTDTSPIAEGHTTLTLGLGARGSIAGPRAALLGAALSVQLRMTSVSFGVTLRSTLPNRIDHDGVWFDLRQHAISAFGMARWPLSSRLELDLGANAGATFYDRSMSHSLDPTWETIGNRTSLSAHLGLVAELRWAFAHSVGLSVLCGTELQLPPLRFDYEDRTEAGDNMRRQLSHLGTLEPWLALSLSADLLSF